MLKVVVETASLRRAQSGRITGRVCLRGPAGDFPESEWSDFPVVVLTWWVEGLHDLASGRVAEFRGLFMDGPFSFTVKVGPSSIARVSYGPRDEETTIGVQAIRSLLESALLAGKLVAEECSRHQWESNDLETLRRSLANAAA